MWPIGLTRAEVAKLSRVYDKFCETFLQSCGNQRIICTYEFRNGRRFIVFIPAVTKRPVCMAPSDEFLAASEYDLVKALQRAI